jgi:hypothetical protein
MRRMVSGAGTCSIEAIGEHYYGTLCLRAAGGVPLGSRIHADGPDSHPADRLPADVLLRQEPDEEEDEEEDEGGGKVTMMTTRPTTATRSERVPLGIQQRAEPL